MPQIVGPKFLNSLQNTVGLPVINDIGMASPIVVADIANGGGAALDLMLSEMDAPVCGLNLCASMAPAQVETACLRLLDHPGLVQPH